MYIEEQYIEEQFRKNFIEGKDGNIIIYGTGIHTEKLLKKIHTDRIAGLMDAKKTGENLWGYPVFSYEEVANIENVYIVILARNAVINIIYRRIEVFCRENQIDVFDIHGNRLGSEIFTDKSHECFLLDEGELIKKICENEVITFDIFDTLIMRKVIAPQDIFTVIDEYTSGMEFCFSKERKYAESCFEEGENPSIYEIYDRFQKNTGISDKEKKRLLMLEIDIEKKFLCKRERMCEILSYAVNQGKKVYLVSDMYFTKEIIEEILEAFDIKGYLNLFVSCEYGRGKQEGLFQIVQEQIFVHNNLVLHIGDDFYADVKAAEEAGFHVFQIYSAREMFEQSIYADMFSELSMLDENIGLAYFISLAYNNPFGGYQANGKLILEKREQITKLFIAPIIFKFMVFLCQRIQNEDFDVIVFPSRDGYLLWKLYERIKGLIPTEVWARSIYFYTSRRAALISAVQDMEDVLDIIKIEDTREFRKTIETRFGVKLSGQAVLSQIKDMTPDLLQNLLQACKREQAAYMEYIKCSGILSAERIAFIDFMAVGTVQEALQRMVEKQFHGFYFLKRDSEEEKFRALVCDTIYEKAGDFETQSNIYKYYYFLETILSSYEPTFERVSEEGNLQFYKEYRSKEQIEELRKVHDSVLDYVEEMLNLIPNILKCVSSVELYDKLLGLLSKDYSEFNDRNFLSIQNVDEFMGRIVSEMNR